MTGKRERRMAAPAIVAVLATVSGVGPLSAQAPARPAAAVHEIVLERRTSPVTEFRFVPASVRARPGDILHFRVRSAAPHSVVFERAGLTAVAHRAWNTALPARTGDLTGPLLRTNGAEYRVTVPDVAPGVYRYYCLPHRAYTMEGSIEVIAR